MTRTLTALFTDHASAERAAERRRAAGVPEAALETHRATEGDVAPGDTPSGLFAAGDLLRSELDTPGLGRGRAAGTVLLASRVPDGVAAEAARIPKQEAAEVEDSRDP